MKEASDFAEMKYIRLTACVQKISERYMPTAVIKIMSTMMSIPEAIFQNSGMIYIC